MPCVLDCTYIISSWVINNVFQGVFSIAPHTKHDVRVVRWALTRSDVTQVDLWNQNCLFSLPLSTCSTTDLHRNCACSFGLCTTCICRLLIHPSIMPTCKSVATRTPKIAHTILGITRRNQWEKTILASLVPQTRFFSWCGGLSTRARHGGHHSFSAETHTTDGRRRRPVDACSIKTCWAT